MPRKSRDEDPKFQQSLADDRLFVGTVFRNPPPGFLYDLALKEGYAGRKCAIASNGALIAYSGAKTGRSPKDKRLVQEPSSQDDINWGDINIPIGEDAFQRNLDMAIGFLNGRQSLFVIDGFAGWRGANRIKVRVVCARPYHAMFMTNMLIRPTDEELANFGEPDWVIYNAGQCPADSHIKGVTSKASVDINLKSRQMVILGTEYAGCMKKGVFTILNYLLPKQGILSMHCSANEAIDTGEVALFFGLSGTGKTTLSADPDRRLIGDDEHGWDDHGVFNIEGGCYAKTINLSAEKEPEIYQAIRFGTVLENVVYDPLTHEVDYDDDTITQNTRASYPIEFMPTAKVPCTGTHPNHIVFLTCDAYGVLPPISKLTPEQAMYHFISGYTAKVAGTEVGVTEPQATFSACFGEAFMVWHPTVYAKLLKEKIERHQASCWLINTGW
ncbi:MAG: phosphoenolpyruvate carboxykinase (ATP), partial [Cyanobacteria bacterium HKST-UBA03]|nr:phosphoenolpyruvate carboxykinase (ATP) [Cyanobacteria bacterium HKST-UBA03]